MFLALILTVVSSRCFHFPSPLVFHVIFCSFLVFPCLELRARSFLIHTQYADSAVIVDGGCLGGCSEAQGSHASNCVVCIYHCCFVPCIIVDGLMGWRASAGSDAKGYWAPGETAFLRASRHSCDKTPLKLLSVTLRTSLTSVCSVLFVLSIKWEVCVFAIHCTSGSLCFSHRRRRLFFAGMLSLQARTGLCDRDPRERQA